MDSLALASTDRWSRLEAFVRRWYAEPLGASSAPIEMIQQTEQRIGTPLPLAVREWFVLVGHRLVDVQDRPARCDNLETRNGRLRLWQENQDNWSLYCELSSTNDEPSAWFESESGKAIRQTRVTEALLWMVYNDTLVGAWSERHVGPLGPLAEGVYGEVCEPASPRSEHHAHLLPALDIPGAYDFAEPLRGHETLVIRKIGEGEYAWMSASEESYAEASTLFVIDEQKMPRPWGLSNIRFLVVERAKTPAKIGRASFACHDSDPLHLLGVAAIEPDELAFVKIGILREPELSSLGRGFRHLDNRIARIAVSLTLERRGSGGMCDHHDDDEVASHVDHDPGSLFSWIPVDATG